MPWQEPPGLGWAQGPALGAVAPWVAPAEGGHLLPLAWHPGQGELGTGNPLLRRALGMFLAEVMVQWWCAVKSSGWGLQQPGPLGRAAAVGAVGAGLCCLCPCSSRGQPASDTALLRESCPGPALGTAALLRLQLQGWAGAGAAHGPCSYTLPQPIIPSTWLFPSLINAPESFISSWSIILLRLTIKSICLYRCISRPAEPWVFPCQVFPAVTVPGLSPPHQESNDDPPQLDLISPEERISLSSCNVKNNVRTFQNCTVALMTTIFLKDRCCH